MNKTVTNKSKQKKRTIISLLLIGAILIGGAFAFLTAQDSKTNVFTIGKISIDLIENFDADGDGVAETYDAGTKTPPTRENIIPGVDIIKEPYVKNTSSNPCRLYMTVQVPTLTKAEAYVQNDGDSYTLDGERKIEIKAYAIQDGYADKTDKTEIWNEYFSKNLSSDFGTEDTTGGKVQMFNIKGIDSESWEIVDSAKPVLAVEENGQYANVYTYVYKGTDNSYLLAGNATTSSLFTSVMLNAEIGGLGTEISTSNGSVIETKGVDENGVERGFIYGLTASMDEDMLKSAVAVENATVKVTNTF